MKLTTESQAVVDRRVILGDRAIALSTLANPHELAPFYLEHQDDRIDGAKDIIVDVLTALFGPSGAWHPGRIVQDEEARDKARKLLDSALLAYNSDSEDYDAEVPA